MNLNWPLSWSALIAHEGHKRGILTLTTKDRVALYAACMPFVRQGGIFAPKNHKYVLGQEVFILLEHMDGLEKMAISGQTGWGRFSVL